MPKYKIPFEGVFGRLARYVGKQQDRSLWIVAPRAIWSAESLNSS